MEKGIEYVDYINEDITVLLDALSPLMSHFMGMRKYINHVFLSSKDHYVLRLTLKL